MVHARYGHQANWCQKQTKDARRKIKYVLSALVFFHAAFFALTLRQKLFNSFQVYRVFRLLFRLGPWACVRKSVTSLLFAIIKLAKCYLALTRPQTDWVLYGQASRAISTR